MIEIFIRQSLGTAGSVLLDFYRANSVWINLLILVYAAAYFIGRINFNKMRGEALRQLQTRLQGKQPSLSLVKKLLKAEPLNWTQVAAASKLPWITLPGKAYPSPIKAELLAEHLNAEKLYALLPAASPASPEEA